MSKLTIKTAENPKRSLCDPDLIISVDAAGLPLPALNKNWIRRKNFKRFTSLHAEQIEFKHGFKDGAALAEWRQNAEQFYKDILYISSLKQHEFWSYMVYEKSVLSGLESLFQNFTPCYWFRKPYCNWVEFQLYSKIVRNILIVISRLLTNDESETYWITNEDIAKIIYKNSLITAAMMSDLVIMINPKIKTMIKDLRNIFTRLLVIEPKYKRDFVDVLEFYRFAFNCIQTQAANSTLAEAASSAKVMETLYDNVAQYTFECAYALRGLLKVSSEVCEIAREIGLGESIAKFYSSTIPLLKSKIFCKNPTSPSLEVVDKARKKYFSAFRSIVRSSLDLAENDSSASIIHCTNFVNLLSECLSHKEFIIDYQCKFPLEADVVVLAQNSEIMDSFKETSLLRSLFVKIHLLKRESQQKQQASSKAADNTEPILPFNFDPEIAQLQGSFIQKHLHCIIKQENALPSAQDADTKCSCNIDLQKLRQLHDDMYDDEYDDSCDALREGDVRFVPSKQLKVNLAEITDPLEECQNNNDNDSSQKSCLNIAAGEQKNQKISDKMQLLVTETKLDSELFTSALSVKTATRDFEAETALILTIFPDYSAADIYRILCYYANTQEAIEAMIDGNLPPHIKNRT